MLTTGLFRQREAGRRHPFLSAILVAGGPAWRPKKPLPGPGRPMAEKKDIDGRPTPAPYSYELDIRLMRSEKSSASMGMNGRGHAQKMKINENAAEERHWKIEGNPVEFLSLRPLNST